MLKPALFALAILVQPLLGQATRPATTPASADHHDVVRVAQLHQTVDSFGASDAWSFQEVGKWDPKLRERVAELLFSREKGIGLSCWRFNVGAGKQSQTIRDPLRSAETFEVVPGRYDWKRQAGEQWFLRAAKQHGVEQLLAFTNSPPARLTRSGLTNAGPTSAPTNLEEGAEDDFARYLVDILAHFRAEGLAFDYVSPINEPQVPWNQGQEGCRMDNVTIRKVVLALHDELKRRGEPTRIVAPESASTEEMRALSNGPTTRFGYAVGDYINVICSDPEMAAALNKTICHHIYNAHTGRDLITSARTMRERMSRFPDWKIWMSEICIMQRGRDLGMESGLTLARMVHAMMAIEGAAAFHWWLALSPYDYKDGLLYTDWKKPGDPEGVLESKMLWSFGNFSRFVRPGWKRVELTGENHSDTGLMASAYVDPAGGKLAAVYVNLLPEAQRVRLTVEGMNVGRSSLYITSESKNLERQQLAADGWLEIPARSVVTWLGEK
ncbi:MAG TPA: glycoside hydrolase [Tepidisphaeraceae bacterium]|nr:glycoside hydrolase [Tepidisphaeraceae bacterium]